MLRNLMSFDNVQVPYGGDAPAVNLTQIFFGGGYYTIGGNISIVTAPTSFSPHFPGARTGPGALAMSGGGAADSATQIFDAQAKWTVGFGFCTDVASVDTDMMWVADGIPGAGGTIQFGVGITGDNRIYAKYGGGTQSSAAGVFTTLKWAYVEVQSTCANSGTITVKLNGAVLLTVTGVNTNPSASGIANTVSLCCTAGAVFGVSLIYYDDVYILDGQDGSGGNPAKSANNDFLGPVHVPCAFPNGPGFYSQFTPLANANWQEVNHLAFSDAAYVSSLTPGAKDTYGFLPDAGSGAKVFGVQLNVIARKDEAGPRILAPLYRGEAADFPQTARELGLSTDYETVQCQFDNDPATAKTWTSDGVTTGQFGQIVEG